MRSILNLMLVTFVFSSIASAGHRSYRVSRFIATVVTKGVELKDMVVGISCRSETVKEFANLSLQSVTDDTYMYELNFNDHLSLRCVGRPFLFIQFSGFAAGSGGLLYGNYRVAQTRPEGNAYLKSYFRNFRIIGQLTHKLNSNTATNSWTGSNTGTGSGTGSNSNTATNSWTGSNTGTGTGRSTRFPSLSDPSERATATPQFFWVKGRWSDKGRLVLEQIALYEDKTASKKTS